MSQDIQSLEMEFAKNPKSEVFIPLCEAYLEQKRFMEAMVVCKKGIKNLPAQDPRGRLLLATIYHRQGKKPKADQELANIQQAFPNNADVFATIGQFKQAEGSNDEAIGFLQQAVALNPAHPQAIALLQQLGIAVAPAPAAAPQMPPQMPPQPGMQQPPAPQPGVQQPLIPQAAPMQQPVGQQPLIPQAAPGVVPQAPTPQAAPGMAPQAPMPQTPLSPTASAPAAPAPKLEHVDDFFAKDALGFSDDNIPEHMQTAGPGRLTIIGFVPKAAGNIKLTLMIILGVVLAFSAYLTYFYFSSNTQRKIMSFYKTAKSYMEQDTYTGYNTAIDEAMQVLKLDETHMQTLSILAYAHAVLAVDHGISDSLAKADEFYKRAVKSSEEHFSYRIAANGLIHYGKGEYQKGYDDLKTLVEQGATHDLIDLELFRLRLKLKLPEEEMKKSLHLLSQSVGNGRVFNFLGYYYYDQGQINKADSFFGQALNSNRNHIGAILGGALAKFTHGFDLTAEAEKDIKRAKALAQESSPRDNNMLTFTEGMFHLKLLQTEEADKFFSKVKREQVPTAMVFRRGLLYLDYKMYKEATTDLEFVHQAFPNSINYLEYLAKAYAYSKAFDKADAKLKTLAELDKENSIIPLLRGKMAELKRKDKDAITFYSKVTSSGGQNYIDAHVAIAHIELKGRKKDKALKTIETLLSSMPAGSQPGDQARVLAEYGLAYEALKQKDAAMESFLNARDTFRFYAPTHYYICRAEKGDEAKRSCKTYLKLTPWGEFRQEAAKKAGCKLDDLKACFTAN